MPFLSGRWYGEPNGRMMRLMAMRAVPVLMLTLVAACVGVPADESRSAAQQAEDSASAEALCAGAATVWGGSVAAAFSATVEEVRGYMTDPHEAEGDASAPAPGPYDFPAGWEAMGPADTASACYLDGAVPKGPPPPIDGSKRPPSDRRLVIAADGVQSFMVSAGPKEAMPMEALPS